MTNELVETLRDLRVKLKSGEYDGADLMRAWCAMAQAADEIEYLQKLLTHHTVTPEPEACICGQSAAHCQVPGHFCGVCNYDGQEHAADCPTLKSEATQMAMLPNEHHPGLRCSCRECLSNWPSSRT